MRLSDCDDTEVTILVAMVALALQLPGELERYTRAIGEIREQYFKIPGSQYVRNYQGFVDVHKPRATKPWQ